MCVYERNETFLTSRVYEKYIVYMHGCISNSYNSFLKHFAGTREISPDTNPFLSSCPMFVVRGDSVYICTRKVREICKI